MIIDTDKIAKAIMDWDKLIKEVAEKYGLEPRTVGAYRRGELDYTNMKLSTAMKIMNVIMEDQIKAFEKETALLAGTKFLYAYDDYQIFQDLEDETHYIKVYEDNIKEPVEYNFSPILSTNLQLMISSLFDLREKESELEEQGYDLDDIYKGMELQYFD